MRKNMLKDLFSLKSFFICFVVLLCFSACSKKQNEEQTTEEVSVNADFNSTNNAVSEKLNDAIESIESSNTETPEDLLQAVELKLKFNEILKNGRLQSKDELYTKEELELLSSEDLNQYISTLLLTEDDIIDNGFQYVMDNKLIDKLNAKTLKHLYYDIVTSGNIDDTEKTLENFRILYSAAKNLGDLPLLDEIYTYTKRIADWEYNAYFAQSICAQLLEYYGDDPEKNLELQQINLKQNARIAPYTKFEENLQAFLKQADQQHTNYVKFLELYAIKKVENQLVNEAKMDKWECENIIRGGNVENYHNNIIKDIKLNENNAEALEYLNKQLEKVKIFLNAYSNHLQQIETIYLK